MIDFLNQWPQSGKVLLSVGIILALYLIRKVIVRAISRRVEDPELLFRSRRVST